jgi:hypothetical protein
VLSPCRLPTPRRSLIGAPRKRRGTAQPSFRTKEEGDGLSFKGDAPPATDPARPLVETRGRNDSGLTTKSAPGRQISRKNTLVEEGLTSRDVRCRAASHRISAYVKMTPGNPYRFRDAMSSSSRNCRTYYQPLSFSALALSYLSYLLLFCLKSRCRWDGHSPEATLWHK